MMLVLVFNIGNLNKLNCIKCCNIHVNNLIFPVTYSLGDSRIKIYDRIDLLARLHEVHRAIVVTSVVPVYVYVYVYVYVRVTLSVKVFISLHLLTMLMDQVDTLHVARYWSEVLRSTIMTHPG